MKQYRKKPVVVEAMQFQVHKGWQVEQWSDGNAINSPILEPSDDDPTGEYLQIKTPEGVMTAIPGDYIIKGVKGEFYPCKPDIFEMTYEEVER